MIEIIPVLLLLLLALFSLWATPGKEVSGNVTSMFSSDICMLWQDGGLLVQKQGGSGEAERLTWAQEFQVTSSQWDECCFPIDIWDLFLPEEQGLSGHIGCRAPGRRDGLWPDSRDLTNCVVPGRSFGLWPPQVFIYERGQPWYDSSWRRTNHVPGCLNSVLLHRFLPWIPSHSFPTLISSSQKRGMPLRVAKYLTCNHRAAELWGGGLTSKRPHTYFISQSEQASS